MKNKIKKWAIHKLGGYTKCDVEAIAADYKAKINELNEKHETFIKYHNTGYELDHRKDGSGVARLIEEILFESVQANLGDQLNPRHGASKADVMETDAAISDWANRVADDVARFVNGICKRDCMSARWGVPNCRCGVKAMMGMSAGRIDSPLGRFARIWRKEHPDTRMKDVLDEDRQKRWSKLDKTVKAAVNVAVQNGMTFWK